MGNGLKRVFFGWEAVSPWPSEMPPGRMIDESFRHLTLAFLGQTDINKLNEELASSPPPPFKVGRAGQFTESLLLPTRHPNVVAWNISWYDPEEPIKHYQKQLSSWLVERDFLQPETREWLPHVTLCRRPFNENKWSRAFHPLPIVAKNIHLYESLGNLNYVPIWSYPLMPAFEELDHTADIAFRVFGETIEEIYLHAFTALSFKFTEFLPFLRPAKGIDSVDEIVIRLNESIAYADQSHRCPYKAVSFHGGIEQNGNILQWDMIVDV